MAISTSSSSSSQESLHELLSYPVVAAGRDPDSLNALDLDTFSSKSSFRIATLDPNSLPFVDKEVKRTDLVFHNNTGKCVDVTCISRNRRFGPGDACFREFAHLEPGENSKSLSLRHNQSLPFTVTYKAEDEDSHLFLDSIPYYERGAITRVSRGASRVLYGCPRPPTFEQPVQRITFSLVKREGEGRAFSTFSREEIKFLG